MSFLNYDGAMDRSLEVNAMSTVEISLRLSGQLPETAVLNRELGAVPTQARRRGEPVSKRRVQPVDLWLLELTQWDDDRPIGEIESSLQQVATQLAAMAKPLAMLDRTQCQADLYISTVREDDQGGLGLPAALVMAAGAAGLGLQFSILVTLDDVAEPTNVALDSLAVGV
jgi:Domain of unknown function (DUF4279)